MKHFLVYIALSVTVCGFGQDNYINTTSSIPPSPTSASLGKYGDVPVSLYTGVPEISIPLYSVAQGNLSLPVSLSYHSQGFKTDELASYAGLGWSLNAGGTITRAVKGVPDDFNGDLWGTTAQLGWNYCPNVTVNGDCRFPSYGYLSGSIDGTGVSYDTYYEELSKNIRDGESDIFYFNFAGNSGQFVFNKFGVPKFFSKQNLEITYTRNAGGDIDKFQAIDGDGVIYYFETYEVTTTSNARFSVQDINGNFSGYDMYTSVNELENSFYYNGTTLSPFISSWYLTKIKSPNATHEINFTYINETQQFKSGFSQQYAYGINANNFSSSFTFLSVASKKISEITWASGKVVFAYNLHRQDIGCNLPGGYTYIPNYALTDVSIFNQSTVLLKKYTLDYNYFGITAFADPNQNNGSNYDCNSRKLKLVSVKEYNSLVNEFKPPYVFDYNTSVALKPTYTSVKDFWGFQKVTAPTTNGSRIPKVYYSPTGTGMQYFKSKYSVYPPPSGTYNSNGTFYDISPEASCQTAFLLTKITYPTGGSTSFEFEAHQFELFGINRLGGGARIKKMTDYDGINTSTSIIKNYTYMQETNPSLSSGVVMALPTLAKRAVSCNENQGTTFFTNSVSGLGSTFGSIVGYSKVDVEFNGNGKTVNLFNTQGAIGVATEECVNSNCIYQSTGSVFVENGYCIEDNFPFAQNPNFDWYRGALQESRIYNNSNQMVNKTVNEYTVKNYEKIDAVKAGVYNGHSQTNAQITKYAPYYYLSGWKVLSKQTTTEYDVLNAGRQLQTIANYFYDNADHLQLTKTTTTNSKGQTLESVYKRSKDYPGTTNGMIAALNSQHRFNEVIESQSWLQGSPKKLLGASFNYYFDYKTQNGLANPQNLIGQKYSLVINTPLPQTSFVETWYNNGIPFLDPKYELISFYNYDSKDNLTKQSILNGDKKNHTANIFGHTKSLVIAQVNNATETDCGFTSFESDDQNLWAMGGTVVLNTTDRHTGTSCRTIPANTFGPTRNYMPSSDFQNSKFIMSCWVKTNSNAVGPVGSLVLTSVADINATATFPNVAGSYIATAINNTNNVWKYIEVEIDLKQIKALGGIPNTALALRSFVWNTHASIALQVDDIRFYPKQARMTSYTYIPLIGVSSISDENSNCQYYEYDSFGRLKIVKDQNGKILEKTDYNYKP